MMKMPVFARLCVLLTLAVGLQPGPLAAQDLLGWPLPKDAPDLALPRREWDHRHALVLYGQALVCERANEPVEACRLLEQAVQLDPDSATLHRSLVPLYAALDRTKDALRESQEAFRLDPADYEIGDLYARQLRDLGRLKEAADVMVRVVASPRLKKRLAARAALEFEFGRLAQEVKQPARAEQAFREAAHAYAHLRAQPDEDLDVTAPMSKDEVESRLVDAYERWIEACGENKHYDAAVAAFTEADKKGLVTAPRLRYQLVQVYIACKQPKQALQQLETYLRSQPTETAPYELRSRLLTELGRADDIVPGLEDYARRDAHNVGLQLLLARQYTEADRPADAEAQCRRLLMEAPSPEVYQVLFELYKNRGRMGEALSMLDTDMARAADKKGASGTVAAANRARAMLAALRDHADLGGPLVLAAQEAMQRGQRLDIETERLLAALAQRAHQLEAAEQFFRLCLDGRHGRQSDFEIYYGLLSTLSQEHKPEEVVALCRRGLKEAPLVNRRLFHDYLARALAMLGKDEEALAAADQVVDLASADTRVAARIFRADILRLLGRYDKGIAECQALLQETHDPKEVHDIRYTLSGIYSAARQIAKAEATLRLILEKDPDDATANNDLGYMLADEGKSLPEAEAMIRKAIRLEREQRRKGKGVQVGLDDDQDHAAYLDSLAWVLFRRGQVREGLAQLKKAAALPDGEDPVIWDHLGDVYFRLDRPEKARTAWQKAVSLYESAATGRRPDEQYKNIKHKLRLLATNARLKSSHAADSERPGPQR